MQNSEGIPLVKEVKPINFLFFRTETNVNDIGQLLPVAKQLFKEAVEHDLQITGPIQWHYFGFTGDASKTFTIEIGLPVANVLKEYDGVFHFKRTENFKSVSLVHEGSWFELPKSYSKLMEFVQRNNLQPSAVTREVYINADFDHPEANMTEIQMGINNEK